MKPKKADWFHGIFPALVTPFTQDDRIDEQAFRQLIRSVLPHVNGVVPNGTTGEFSSLTFEERQEVIRICVEEVRGQVPVLAGTSCPSTLETLELTKWAKDAGASGALVCAPYFIKPAFNEVYDHYGELDTVGLPLVLYNIPQTAGTHFRWWTAEGMGLAFDNVIGLKDSSGDMPFFMAALEKLGDTISIFCGHDEIAGVAMLAGGDGAILASANIIPDIWQEIFQAAKRDDNALVRSRHKEIQILARLVVRKGGGQACKEALRMMDMRMSNARLPVIQGGIFEREDYEDMRTQLGNLGKIPKTKKAYADMEIDYMATSETPDKLEDLTMCVGEGFAGPPFSEVAHIDLLLGLRSGPVGKAIERALGEPRPGHELKIINEHPQTMLVPTVTVRGSKAAQLVYGEATNGINLAITHAIARHPPGALVGKALHDHQRVRSSGGQHSTKG
jgi:4-hydroxy-tetrahydrodipicolinate synthase